MSLKEIFKYRNIWMALAILWIVFYHSGFIISNNLLHAVKVIGYGGVDIFLFASGLGCYFSLKKNNNIGQFLKRRFIKIMPTYWCFIVFWIILKYMTSGISISAIVGNILCIQTFTGLDDSFNWYIDMLLLLYFFSPYLMLLVDKIKTWKGLLVSIFFLLLFSVPFYGIEAYIIGFTRIPIFFLGMYFAKMCYEVTQISKKQISLLMTFMIIGIIMLIYFYHNFDNLWYYGLHWYPFILITPGLCILISFICMKTKSIFTEKILLLLKLIGDNTLEIYLVHITVFSIVSHLISSNVISNNNLYWMCSLLLVIVGCIFLKLYVNTVLKIVKKWIT